MTIECDCGGTLRPAQLKDFDLKTYVGVPAIARAIQGYRCDRCGYETIDSAVMLTAANALAGMILSTPERLSKQVLRFLRLRLDLTQQELAKKMGVARKTVNEWETKGAISPQNDHLLRVLVYVHLNEAFRPRLSVLEHVATAAPRSKLAPLVVPKIEDAVTGSIAP